MENQKSNPSGVPPLDYDRTAATGRRRGLAVASFLLAGGSATCLVLLLTEITNGMGPMASVIVGIVALVMALGGVVTSCISIPTASGRALGIISLVLNGFLVLPSVGILALMWLMSGFHDC